MSRGVSNLSGISNNDLVLLRRIAKKHDKVTVKAGMKKIEVEGVQASVALAGDLTFVSVPAVNAIYRKGELITGADVASAIKELKQAGRSPSKTSKRSTAPQLPEDLRKQLEAFAKENNSRVIFDPANPSGYKVQKLRPRAPKE